VTGGAQTCGGRPPCLRWGPVIPAPAGACTIQLIDDGLEEPDLAVECSGTLCLIGGITP
jgi:hypothetical protein